MVASTILFSYLATFSSPMNSSVHFPITHSSVPLFSTCKSFPPLPHSQQALHTPREALQYLFTRTFHCRLVFASLPPSKVSFDLRGTLPDQCRSGLPLHHSGRRVHHSPARLSPRLLPIRHGLRRSRVQMFFLSPSSLSSPLHEADGSLRSG